MKRIALAVAMTIAAGAVFAQWKYEVDKDPMTDAIDKRAILKSDNKFEFSFPYGGGTSEWLYLQKIGDKQKIVVGINRGQILANKGITIRFDNGDLVDFEAHGTSDGSTELAFLEFPGHIRDCKVDTCGLDSKDVVDRLLTSKRIKVQATYYDQGSKVFEFRTQGLKWAE